MVADADKAQPRLPLHDILVHRLLIMHHHAVEDIKCQLTHQCDTCTQFIGQILLMRAYMCAMKLCSWSGDHLPG